MGDSENINENDDIEIIQDIIGKDVLFTEDVVDLTKDPNKVSEKEIVRVETELDNVRKKQAENSTFGFIYRSNCRTCEYALNDPDIHQLYLDHNFSIQPVVDFINEKYVPDVTIKWDQVKSHMENHFMPKYKEADVKRKEFYKMLNQRLRDKEKKSVARLDELTEIMYMKVEELFIYTDAKDVRSNRETAKVISQLALAMKGVYELQLKMLMGDDDPEEQKKKITNLMKAKFASILQSMPQEKREEFMEYMNKKD